MVSSVTGTKDNTVLTVLFLFWIVSSVTESKSNTVTGTVEIYEGVILILNVSICNRNETLAGSVKFEKYNLCKKVRIED